MFIQPEKVIIDASKHNFFSLKIQVCRGDSTLLHYNRYRAIFLFQGVDKRTRIVKVRSLKLNHI